MFYLLYFKTEPSRQNMIIPTDTYYFYFSFLSQTFKNHRTAEEWGGPFLNSSLPLPSASQTCTH